MIIKIILIFTLLVSFNLFAKTGSVTGLEIPRYVSLKSDEVNLRIGPSVNYPIKIKYIYKNLPIEIIEEFDVWRKVKDHENNFGWIHKSLIKGERYVLTYSNNSNVYNRPNGKKIAVIHKNNILDLKKCLSDWCYISHSKVKGWISKTNIWGVYKLEIYNINLIQTLINQYWRILDSNLFKK